MKVFFQTVGRIILFFCIVLTVSCSVQKRQRLPGVHIEWHKGGVTDKEVENTTASKSIKNPRGKHLASSRSDLNLKDTENLEASIEKQVSTLRENEFVFYSKLLTHFLVKEKKDSCDLIITQEGEFVYAERITLEGQFLRFKACNDANESWKKIPTELVFMVKYKDGSKKVFAQTAKNSQALDGKKKGRSSTDDNFFRLIDEVSLVGSIFGAASIPIWFVHWQIGIFLSIFAIVMGVIGIVRIVKSRGSRTGLGLAIASLLIGLTLLITTIAFMWPAFV